MLGAASSGMSTCFLSTSVAALGRARSLSRHASISAGSRLLVGEPGALDSVEVALVVAACLRVLSAISDIVLVGAVSSNVRQLLRKV